MQPVGEIYPEAALILAPLSGFTDIAYRRAARRCGCVYAFTEMIDAASLAYASERTMPMLFRGEDEDFLGVQLVGADPKLLRRAVEMLNEREFSVLDFNLGCPVPKVCGKGAGAALGAAPEHAARCLGILAERSRFPVTAKIRILDENDPEPTVKLATGLYQAGAQALTVHGRTRKAFYTGEIHYQIIRAIREALPIPVIANGGVYSAKDYRHMTAETGCSRVMLAQGAMGNPWLFRELSGSGTPPDLTEWRCLVREHIGEMVSLYGEYAAMRQARKIVHDYLRGRGFAGALKSRASLLSSLADLDDLLREAVPVAVSPSRPFKGVE